jgi:hypothetical protein
MNKTFKSVAKENDTRVYQLSIAGVYAPLMLLLLAAAVLV